MRPGNNLKAANSAECPTACLEADGQDGLSIFSIDHDVPVLFSFLRPSTQSSLREVESEPPTRPLELEQMI